MVATWTRSLGSPAELALAMPGPLGALVETAYEPVWRFCAVLVGDQSADDVSQETFCRVVRALPNFGAESSALTWLLAIGRHVCLDELRARSRRRRCDAAMGSGQDGAVADASADVTVVDLIRRLGKDRRAAFVLTQLLGLSYDEAARVCGCPPRDHPLSGSSGGGRTGRPGQPA